jgi:hypothetical protein
MIPQDNWYCKLCHRQFKKHLKVGEEAIEGGRKIHNADNWCFDDKQTAGNETNSWGFKPVDNLTQIELTAKKKGIIKENSKA